MDAASRDNLWDNLCDIAADIRPDLIVTTGDLVNNPFRWTLKSAAEAINSLKTRVERTPGHTCHVLVIPGNHDTRCFGLIPLRWFTWFAIICWGIGAVFLYVHSRWAIAAAAVAAVLSLWRLLFKDFRSAFSELVVTNPISFDDLGIAIYPFDSASKTLSSARGRIPPGEFVASRRASEPLNGRGDLYRIAILHHHPLPIPYDHQFEPLLVLDNAGAFLSEASRLRIRLVLHGHKHHQDYSRISTKLESGEAFELGVLASGTPTAGSDHGPEGFNFHVLEFDSEGGPRAVPYQAHAGGGFNRLPSFPIEALDLEMRRTFENERQRLGREYGSVVSVRRVSADGDVYNRIEYRDLRITRMGESLTKLPHAFTVYAGGDTGSIERLTGFPLSPEAAGLHLSIDTADPTAFALKRQSGKLQFGRTIQSGSAPISFGIRYYAINACAMSAMQYGEMYVPNEPPIEWIPMKLVEAPTRELVLTVQLPRDTHIEGRAELVTSDGRENRRLAALNSGLVHDPDAGLIICRIPYPLLEVDYRIQWRLAPQAPVAIQAALRLRGEVTELTRQLLELQTPHPAASSRRGAIDALREVALQSLQISPDDPLEVAIMIYDPKQRHLKVVAASFEEGDERWNWNLKYGDGIAGRAFKMQRARLFIKAKAAQEGTPYYYLLPSGRPISQPEDIPVEALVALPLSHPADRSMVYGVLSLGSTRPSSRLVEFGEEDAAIREYWKGANDACFKVLKELN